MANQKLSPDKRREVVELMRVHLRRSEKKPDMWMYQDDWSDSKLANVAGVTVASVIGIRTSMYGKLDGPGYVPVGQMAKRIVALEEEVANLKAEIRRRLPQSQFAPATNGAAMPIQHT